MASSIPASSPARPAPALPSAPGRSLPARPNLEHLKKLAKRRLKSLRQRDPRAKLALAQLEVARELGFPSWRALKARVDERAAASPAATISGDDVPRLMLQAVGRGDVDAVRRLLAAAPQLVNMPGEHPFWGGRPQPLHVAIERGHEEMFRVLLDAGADVNAADAEYGRWSPLMLAVHWRRDAMRDELMRREARVGLIEALMLGDEPYVRAMLRAEPGLAHAGPFPNDGTPLHFVRAPGAAKLLLDAGVDPEAKDKYGQRAVDAMMKHGAGLLPVIRRLIRNGVEVDPASLAAAGELRRLQRFGKGIGAAVRNPAVIHAAAEHGHLAMMKWLLSAGADVNARATTGSKGAPLHTAAWNGQLDVAKLLVEHGADVRAVDEEHHTTPAHWARTALTMLNREPCRAVAEYLESVSASPASGDQAFDPDAVARQAVGAMQRAWAETHAMIERRFEDAGTGPRWQALGFESRTMLEREADAAIAQRGELGQYRMLSVWHVVHVDDARRARVDPTSRPTRVLEYLRDGDQVRPRGGIWQRIDWTPRNHGITGKLGRFADIAEALAFLQTKAPAGAYRVVSVRRMLRARRVGGKLTIIKKHGAGPTLDPVAVAPGDGEAPPPPPPPPAPRNARGEKPDWKPIMDAAFRGDVDGARRALEAGADPNVVSGTAHRHRPLHRAIEQKKTQRRGGAHEAVVRLLLDRGADPKLRGGYGRLTALQLAATGEHRFVPMLLPYFRPLDIFHAAAVGDAARVADLLKSNPALANAVDANGWGPLHYCGASSAYKQGRPQSDALVRIARLLLDHGADPAATYLFDDKWPLTAMYHCVGHQDNAALAEVLFDAGALPFDGESVFHAADEDHRASLAVIERRSDAKKLAEECTRALRTLLNWGRVRGVPWLLAHGADANSIHPDSGDSSLHSAVKGRSNDRVIKLLLQHGADPRRENKAGKSAIDLARTSTAAKRLLPLLVAKR